jgi:hypothetical protein
MSYALSAMMIPLNLPLESTGMLFKLIRIYPHASLD